MSALDGHGSIRDAGQAGSAPLLMLQLDTELVVFVLLALRQLERTHVSNGMHLPSGLRAFGDFLAQSASGGQRGTSLETSEPVRHVDSVKPLLVSYDTAAGMLDCSNRQVKRLVADGTLTPVSVGGLRRLRIRDIDDFVRASGEPGRAESRQQ